MDAALSAAVVAVPGLIGGGYLPFDELVERVIGERSGLAVVTATGEIAPGVVLGAGGRRAGVGAGGSGRVNALQLVAVAIEVLLRVARAAQARARAGPGWCR